MLSDSIVYSDDPNDVHKLGDKPKLFILKFDTYKTFIHKQWNETSMLLLFWGGSPQQDQQILHCNNRYCKYNTPGTRGWSRLRDRTLAVPKNRAKISFFRKKIKITIFFHIYILVMPKNWGNKFSRAGDSPKWYVMPLAMKSGKNIKKSAFV